jgi:hypothetical protein
MAAIPIPITRTKIATAPWGIPLTNEVNRLTTQSDSNTTRLTAVESKVATTTWVPLVLQNGWSDYLSGRHPSAYRKRGDMLDLRMAVRYGTTGSVVTTLPAGYRPSNLIDLIGRCGNSYGYYNALVDGTIIVYFGTGGDNSLCALNISYPLT